MDIVGGDHHGRAQPVKRLKQPQQLDRHIGIDVAGRLVGDQQLGPVDHCAGDGDALLLAARKLRGQGMHSVSQLDPIEHICDGPRNIAFTHPSDPQWQGDIVKRREVRDQPKVLEHHPKPAAKAGQAFARQGDRIGSEHPDHPARGPLRQIEQLEQRGLARAARPGQEVKAARKQRERDIAEHFAVGAIAQPDIVELDDFPVS